VVGFLFVCFPRGIGICRRFHAFFVIASAAKQFKGGLRCSGLLRCARNDEEDWTFNAKGAQDREVLRPFLHSPEGELL
jgi:hypothetical protein